MTSLSLESPVPYVAPWPTTFTRYATELIAPSPINTQIGFIQVPEPQWYRLVYWYETWAASAVVLTRGWHFEIESNAGATTVLEVVAPSGQTANQWFNYVVAPNASAYTIAVPNQWGYQQMPVPDMLWPPGTRFVASLLNADPGDHHGNASVAAVEVYLPNYDRGSEAPTSATPPLAPLPLTR